MFQRKLEKILINYFFYESQSQSASIFFTTNLAIFLFPSLTFKLLMTIKCLR